MSPKELYEFPAVHNKQICFNTALLTPCSRASYCSILSAISSSSSYASAARSVWDMAISRSQSTRTIRGVLPLFRTICRNRGHSLVWSAEVLLRRYTSFRLRSSSPELSSLSSRCERYETRPRKREHSPPLASTMDLKASKPPRIVSTQCI